MSELVLRLANNSFKVVIQQKYIQSLVVFAQLILIVN